MDEVPLKLANFFIHVENGRRRPDLSARSGILVSALRSAGERISWVRPVPDLTATEVTTTERLRKGLSEIRESDFKLLEFVPCTGRAGSVVAIVVMEVEDRKN